MMDRNIEGKFVAKGEELRKVRSFRLTDSTYDTISQAAADLELSKGDYLEKLNDDGVFTGEDNETSDEDIQEVLDRVIQGLLDDLYDTNELEINSKDKAPVKRYLQALLDNLGEVVSKYQ
jgi:hypothetical protein